MCIDSFFRACLHLLACLGCFKHEWVDDGHSVSTDFDALRGRNWTNKPSVSASSDAACLPCSSAQTLNAELSNGTVRPSCTWTVFTARSSGQIWWLFILVSALRNVSFLFLKFYRTLRSLMRRQLLAYVLKTILQFTGAHTHNHKSYTNSKSTFHPNIQHTISSSICVKDILQNEVCRFCSERTRLLSISLLNSCSNVTVLGF